MFKAKKYLISRLSNTKYGRQKVADNLGEKAQAMLGAIISATGKFTEENTAAKLREDLIKIILKVTFLWNEQKLTEEDAEPAREPVTVLAQTLIEYITKGSIVDVTDVCELVHRVGNSAVEVLSKHMKEKNWSKIRYFTGFFGSKEFAEFFLNSNEVKEERLVFLDILQRLLPDHARRRQCSVVGCALPRVNLPGAEYCFAHHAVKFSCDPVLEDFLKNSEYVKVFRSYLLDERPDKLPLLEFYFKVSDFRSLQRNNLLEERAPTLYRKYIAEAARDRLPLDFTAEYVKQASQKVSEDVLNCPPRSNIFNQMLSIVLDEMERIFEEFRDSEYYKEWAETNMNLPLPKMPKQREEMFEQLGLDPDLAYDVNNRRRTHSEMANCRDEPVDGCIKVRSATCGGARLGAAAGRSPSSASSDSSCELSTAFLKTMRSVSASSPSEALHEKFIREGQMKEDLSDGGEEDCSAD